MNKTNHIPQIENITLVISTKDRIDELRETLDKLSLLLKAGMPVIICDDGSTDGTSHFLKANYPEIRVICNIESRGLIFSRNRLLNMVETDFAISLDDDANFLSDHPLLEIGKYFDANHNCAVTSFRIFWSREIPEVTYSTDKPIRVKSFVGCGHAWRMKAWRDIPNYPDWFIFYGEEDFASYHLFKKNWEVHYLPQVLVHHRVNVKARRTEKDYSQRLRYSLRAGWFLYLLFLPLKFIPRKLAYSIWIQLKIKVFKGNKQALKSLLLAGKDLLFNLPRLIAFRKKLSAREYNIYIGLSDTKIYWHPSREKR
ncbi:glycosyltransferase family 2 protein [Christiangramia sediminis]|uniref:Glycosyltransferase family 2 protein n=1 Tax=Christiangramia sediminis TaxID=2881336 RepID=A0A9X1LJD4_9FLAO|nr:glycosyltransferase family 2 protein [Christiangramia sediminis]MCB7481334.1 glycosyltransferase family 2 protein [Christiangramia sediminis]